MKTLVLLTVLLGTASLSACEKDDIGHTGLELHEQTPASRVQPLDEVYERARSVWLKKRSDAKISFEAKNDGLISAAGFVPDGCMDDCFPGIVIRSIETIE